ncbi:MAG: hypothetical protein PHR49_07360, partial [Methanoculleus sp.]|nr:hypothetical protein [Methanoculleus sp.]
QKYVAVAFYKALAFKALTQTNPQFVFENFMRIEKAADLLNLALVVALCPEIREVDVCHCSPLLCIFLLQGIRKIRPIVRDGDSLSPSSVR